MTNPVLQGGERRSWARGVIAISGSSGLIGSALGRELEQRGVEVRRLVRRAARVPVEVAWDPERGTIDAERLEGVDAVVNLAGENLAQRWSDDTKQRIRDSRVKGTALLARTLAALSTKPRTLLSGSAVGVYGDRGDEVLDETSQLGTDFLASVCKEWEAAAAPAAEAGIRVITARTGLVLSRHGGILAKMLLPFRLGVGGALGTGRQWMSWIGIADCVQAMAALVYDNSAAGPVNLVAPSPVTNEEFTHTLARVVGRPAFFRVPKFALTLAMGEMAESTALASQRVRPRRLLDARFDFQQPTVESALRHTLLSS